jgi:hypothetical protein
MPGRTRRSSCCGMRSRSWAGRLHAGAYWADRAVIAAVARLLAPAAAAAPDRDTGHTTGLAPAPGQGEMDLPERAGTPAGPGRGMRAGGAASAAEPTLGLAPPMAPRANVRPLTIRSANSCKQEGNRFGFLSRAGGLSDVAQGAC